jgi:hypothetical protein
LQGNMKKAIVYLYFFFFTITLYSQATTDKIFGQTNCENLVFNTRELKQFAYNSQCKTEAYPFISNNGKHLYFTNNQSYNWVFYSQIDSISGVWSVPVPITIQNFHTPIIASSFNSKLDVMYFTCVDDPAVYKSIAIEGSKTLFSSPIKLTIINPSSLQNKNVPFSYLSFSENEEEMMAFIPNSAFSTASFKKTGVDVYTFDKFVSFSKNEMGMLVNNGLSYFFTNDDYKNILFCKKRNTLAEDFDDKIYLVKEFESHLNISQLRFAEESKQFVLVLSENTWNKNDIYFFDLDANDSGIYTTEFDKGSFSTITKVNSDVPVLVPNVDIPEKLHKTELIDYTGADLCKIEIGNAFPNPARNHFFLYFNIHGNCLSSEQPVFHLLDQSGRIAYSMVLNKFTGELKVELEEIKSGPYYIRIDYNGISSPLSRINL